MFQYLPTLVTFQYLGPKVEFFQDFDENLQIQMGNTIFILVSTQEA